MIIVTSPSKPFTYSAKGTIRRQASIKEYQDEINAAYDAVKESSQENITAPTDWYNGEAKRYIREVVQKTMKAKGQGVGDDADLFEGGLDR